MTAVKKFCNKHYYAICFFAFLMIYSIVVSGDFGLWKSGDMELIYHSVDFSMGFCSRILQGAIYNLIFDEITVFNLSAYITILVICFFIAVCFFLEKIFVKLSFEHRKICVIIFAFFLTGPITFSNYIVNFGTFDVYWLFFSALVVFFLSKKQLYFLIIPVALAAVMIHYASIICFVPFFAILILYKISCTQQKAEKGLLWTVFSVVVVTTISLAVYFVFFETQNLTYTLEEFTEILDERGVPDTFVYYEYAFYHDAGMVGEETFEITAQEGTFAYFIELVMLQLADHVRVHYEQIKNLGIFNGLFALSLSVPILVFVYKTFKFVKRQNKDNKIKKFAIFCASVLPIVTIAGGFLFSMDFTRWVSHALLPLFSFFLFVLYYEGEYVWDFVKQKISGVHTMFLVSYFVLYAMTCFGLYEN